MPYQRIVCFRFKEGTSEEAIQCHMDSLQELEEEMPQILSYNGGRTVPLEDGTAPSYDSMHYLTFESREDIASYFHHPAHQRVIEENKHIWEDGFVQNAVIDE